MSKSRSKREKPEYASARFSSGQLNALVKIVGRDNVPRVLRGELKVRLEKSLLRKVATAEVKSAARFVADEHLKECNIGWTGSNFDGNLRRKVEENVGDAKSVASRLEQASLDPAIIAELGDKAEFKLAWLFQLIKKQKGAQDGILLTNGFWNICYVKDGNGTLWTVCADWDSDYRDWYVGAYSVEDPGGWNAGDQILSRDS